MTSLLVDTQSYIWSGESPAALSPVARRWLADPAHDVLVSVASLWEMAIKVSRGRLTLATELSDFFARQETMGYSTLGITQAQVLASAQLPWHHRDPFDRIIIAQAMVERIPVVTSDRTFVIYGVEVIW